MLLNRLEATIVAIEPSPTRPDQLLITAQLRDDQRFYAEMPRRSFAVLGFSEGATAIFTFPITGVQVGISDGIVVWPPISPGDESVGVDVVDPLGNRWRVGVTATNDPDRLVEFLQTTEISLIAEPISSEEFDLARARVQDVIASPEQEVVERRDRKPDIILSLKLVSSQLGDLLRKRFLMRQTAPLPTNEAAIPQAIFQRTLRSASSNPLVQLEGFADTGNGTLKFKYVVEPDAQDAGIWVTYGLSSTTKLTGAGESNTVHVAPESSGYIQVSRTDKTTRYTLSGEVTGTM